MSEAREDVLLQNLIEFTRRLKGHGLVVGTERVLAYTRAVAALHASTLDDVYWAGRLTLVGRREHLAIYNRAFHDYFRGSQTESLDESSSLRLHIKVEGELPGAELRDSGSELREAAGPAQELMLTAASPTESLRRRSFEEYSEEEHAETRSIVAQLARRRPRRVSRRTRTSRRRGPRPDLARTLRRALRTEGEPLERSWRRRRVKPRRLVLVLDISGSMGAYARSLAGFAHAAVRAGRNVEAFAFGTRLTRITAALHWRDPDAALRALGQEVPDWEGGTRIGESLKELLDGWGRRGPIRNSIVIILSDGLERGDPQLLSAQMQRLARLAHRIIWVNPLKGSPRYQPLARGMAAALPYVDDFLSGHNLASLETLAEVLAKLGD